MNSKTQKKHFKWYFRQECVDHRIMAIMQVTVKDYITWGLIPSFSREKLLYHPPLGFRNDKQDILELYLLAKYLIQEPSECQWPFKDHIQHLNACIWHCLYFKGSQAHDVACIILEI